jgi:hypothetical protein
MQQSPPASSAVFLIAIVLAVVAICRSLRKLHTTFFILSVMLACFLVGAGIGLALRDPELAAVLGSSLMSIGGIATSIERIRRTVRA